MSRESVVRRKKGRRNPKARRQGGGATRPKGSGGQAASPASTAGEVRSGERRHEQGGEDHHAEGGEAENLARRGDRERVEMMRRAVRFIESPSCCCFVPLMFPQR